MTKKKANRIYDVLVNLGGATEHMRDAFVSHLIEPKREYICFDEWRFSGKLGFGGKYWPHINEVNCYLEDENPETIKLIQQMNKQLKDIINEND